MRKVLLLLLVVTTACSSGPSAFTSGCMEYASWFGLRGDTLVLVSPYDGSRDSVVLHEASRLVCMSSSHVGFLEALGADSLVVAVSGLQFLADSLVRSRAVDIGYDSSPDYETILRLKPDYVIMYSISEAPTPALVKMRDIGIQVLVLHEHLEPHPLGRAEYLKLFGVLSGRREQADSLFAAVRDNYLGLVVSGSRAKVLVNIPYGDQWYIPGRDNYMYRLIHDAGGEILGAADGSRSSVIDMESAFRLSREANFWLHPGWCRSKEDLASVHPLFGEFPVLGGEVWNNTARSMPSGGNAFWETGPIRPDLVLSDLRSIFDGTATGDTLYYYVRLR